jgi:hypothetical protein
MASAWPSRANRTTRGNGRGGTLAFTSGVSRWLTLAPRRERTEPSRPRLPTARRARRSRGARSSRHPGVGYQLIPAVTEAQAFRTNMRASASCLNGFGIFEVAACDSLYILCPRRDRVEARAAGRAP